MIVGIERRAPVSNSALTREQFSTSFDRCFGRVYAYVSRHVHDRESCQRIVREVLTTNLALLVDHANERQELSQLKAASDRLIALESVRTRNESSTSPADQVEGTGDTAWHVSLGSPSG